MHAVTTKDGTKIAYDTQGHGPVVILTLGALNKRGSGKKLSQQLKDHFTVITYDRRGRGDSTDTPDYNFKNEIGDLEALINELGGSAYLYGHSSGAVLALLAAKELGDKVRGLALYEVPYNHDPEAQKAAKTYRQTLKHLLDDNRRGDAVALFVKSVGVTDKQIAAMQHLPLWKGLTAMAPTLAYDTIKIMEEYPKLDVRHIDQPTMVLYGGASPAFMAETAQKLSKALPHAKLLPLENQTHDVKAEVLAPSLVTFFK